MIVTATGAKNIFRVVEQIPLEEIKNQAHGYFGLLLIGNDVSPLPISLKVSSITILSYCHGTQET